MHGYWEVGLSEIQTKSASIRDADNQDLYIQSPVQTNVMPSADAYLSVRCVNTRLLKSVSIRVIRVIRDSDKQFGENPRFRLIGKIGKFWANRIQSQQGSASAKNYQCTDIGKLDFQKYKQNPRNPGNV